MGVFSIPKMFINNKKFVGKNMLYSLGLMCLGYGFYKTKYSVENKIMKMNYYHNSNNLDPLWRSKAKMRLGDKNDVMIISGTGNPELAEGNKLNYILNVEVAERLGVPLAQIDIKRYTDGEINIQVLEEPRAKEVYLIQPTCNPVNENLFELLLLVSALKKGSCKSVTVVLPYYGYASSDKKNSQIIPIAAADVAKMLEIIGVDRVAGIDLHSGQIQGFFQIPADNIESNVIMIDYLLNSNLIRDFNKLTIVSASADEVYRAKKFAEILINKTAADVALSLVVREINTYHSDKMQLVGNVEGNECIIVDNVIYSGKTAIAAADELFKNGAKKVYVFASHGILSGNAIEDLNNSKINKIVITNTVPQKQKLPEKFIVLSSATLIAETIRRMYWNESLSEVYI